MAAPNLLYYGDNLDVLRRHVKDESVDLVYLDPPFNSAQDYNVLFSEHGTKAAAQIKAFEDTWEWNIDAERLYQETVERGGRVSDALRAFRTLLGDSDMMAYLAMMAPRLVELRRVMKPDASIYLHCDPTASHYLKLLMDATFGPVLFRNEIAWKRTGSHNSASRFGPVHDIILYYAKGDEPKWNQQYQPYEKEYLSKFKKIDKATGLAFQDVALTGPGTRQGPSGQPWRGHDPTDKGRHWQPASYLYSKYKKLTGIELNTFPLLERLDKLDAAGLIYWTETGGLPRYKQFLVDAAGLPLPDVWTDIDVINSQADERMHYPTQKPETLLARIIQASSDEGDVVLDPFCGCGTTIAAAQRLKRRWIGIDVTHLAIGLIKSRLGTSYGPAVSDTYEVHGEPTDLAGARQLAEDDKHEFQAWALGLVNARRDNSGKKGADKGIDGKLIFHDEGAGGESKVIILSVKGGTLKATDLRDLRGVVDREKAAIGVLISLEEPSGPMKKEAASGGFYTSPWDDGKYPRLQLRTIAELLAGKSLDYPAKTQTNVTYKKAPKAKPPEAQLPLVAEDEPPYGSEPNGD